MKEKDFQRKFSAWLRHNHPQSGAFELKIVKGTAMPFDAVRKHQIEALLYAHGEHIIYKIPDDTFGQKPFDCLKLTKVDTYVVIYFYYTRGEKRFYMIPIDNFMRERATSLRKSLTEGRAQEIGVVCSLDSVSS